MHLYALLSRCPQSYHESSSDLHFDLKNKILFEQTNASQLIFVCSLCIRRTFVKENFNFLELLWVFDSNMIFYQIQTDQSIDRCSDHSTPSYAVLFHSDGILILKDLFADVAEYSLKFILLEVAGTQSIRIYHQLLLLFSIFEGDSMRYSVDIVIQKDNYLLCFIVKHRWCLYVYPRNIYYNSLFNYDCGRRMKRIAWVGLKQWHSANVKNNRMELKPNWMWTFVRSHIYPAIQRAGIT